MSAADHHDYENEIQHSKGPYKACKICLAVIGVHFKEHFIQRLFQISKDWNLE